MHIEPGVLNAAKIVYANAAAAGAVLSQGRALLRAPYLIGATLLAAFFFSILMEVYHVKIGPSELHFIGASLIYTVFGFVPTMLGFALGLLWQGLLFEPGDLVHLGVNALSLIIPLIATHALVGRHFFASENKTAISWIAIVRFDALYYAGVVAMVGFWLSLGEQQTAFTAWLTFALAYAPLIFCEPVFTAITIKLLKRIEGLALMQTYTMVPRLGV